ncbi:MAG TPA: cupin domain-containing protein [Myxococcales bacterium]|nr:cupin domain-containing protein [Myxococcales bacterium]HIL81671.1 cupin domain-containing protein [Myxococcales bacterium]
MSTAARERPLHVAGFDITVLASGTDTVGYEVFYQAGPAGKGPGPHAHPWDESFFATEGTVICGVEDTEIVAGVGDFVHIPGGKTHQYRFGSPGGDMLSITSRGNASKMYEDFDR